MNIKLISILLVVIPLCLCSSCSENEPIGKWDDNIHLSTKSVNFPANADSTILTTEGEDWWLNEILVESIEYYGFDSIDVLSDAYLIKVDSLTFERRDKTTIVIKVGKNPMSKERNFGIVLQSGNYFDYINIIQEAD